MKKPFQITAILLITLLFTACRTSPIYNVQESKIEGQKSADNVYKIIKEAGKSLGWKITQTQPGIAEGKLHLRTHLAVIKITYTNRAYNIDYVSSSNLDYDPESKEIHSNYNGWVQNLEKAIDIRL
ncbi:MAG: Putative lipoprotein [uncultured Sulfurovum sp.]|uniref:Lipoprotein n=1 Tax=uncultured Sulfurovum sp. TaxID=269237 RepID=A0A6S6TVG7_9BACT|nr:MAG: Putative lipoprotein [uncultured Sulfurovum sp.]